MAPTSNRGQPNQQSGRSSRVQGRANPAFGDGAPRSVYGQARRPGHSVPRPIRSRQAAGYRSDEADPRSSSRRSSGSSAAAAPAPGAPTGPGRGHINRGSVESVRTQSTGVTPPQQQPQLPTGSNHDLSNFNGGNNGVVRRSVRKFPSDLRLQLSGWSKNLGDIPEGAALPKAGIIAGRQSYTEVQLEQAFQTRIPPEEQKAHIKSIMEERRVGQERKGKKEIALGIIYKYLPFIQMFKNYKLREYGPYDLISGVSVGLFLIPQSMAYSLLANVRPQYGFYSAFFSMLIYFFLGSAAHVNMTNQGAVSLLVGEAVREGVNQVYPNGVGLCADPASSNYSAWNATTSPAISSTPATTTTTRRVSTTTSSDSCVSRDDANALVALTITMIAGIIQLLGGFFRLGFLTIYLSDPINKAFTCGAALHIVAGQVGNMLGAPIPNFSGNGKFFKFFIEAFKQLAARNVNVPTILVFFGSFIILFAVKIVNEKFIKKIRFPIPIDIVVLVFGLIFSRFLHWHEFLNVATVGEIKKGFEAPRVPIPEHFTTGSSIIVDGIVLGVIAYAMTISLAKTFALRNGYEVDPNQEMVAYGAANFGGCWFGTFVSASAIACSSLHESLKGKTLVYSIYAIVITFLSIMVVAPEFAEVPKCLLSAIIIVNLKNMINQVDQLPGLWRTNRYDFVIFIVTLAAILGLDLPVGLLIGVVFSLATVIFRTQAPKAYLLGRLPHTDIYRNIKKHRKAEQIPGLKIFKFDGSLYFASADNYRNKLYRQVGMHPKKILAKAKATAKKEGREYGELDLRTDIIRSEGIRHILDVVRKEGCHPTPEGRREAQETTGEPKRNLSFQSVRSSLVQSMTYRPPEEVPSTVNVFCIILDLSACAFTDSVGIRLLSQIVEEFNKIGVEIYLSGVTWIVRSQLRRANFYAKRSEDGLFVTVHDAVLHALSALYLELLEDEKLLYQLDKRSDVSYSSVSRSLSTASGLTTESQARAKLEGAELARDRRRRIRHGSFINGSVETLVSGESDAGGTKKMSPPRANLRVSSDV